MVEEVVIKEDANQEDDGDERPVDINIGYRQMQGAVDVGVVRRALELANKEAHQDSLHHPETLLAGVDKETDIGKYNKYINQ